MELINSISVNCIYCDDVRHEVSGKITVVGMYSEGAPIPYPPQGILVLPKFCIIAGVRIPIEQTMQKLRCELRLDDEVVHGVDMPADTFNEANAPMRKDQKWITAQLIMEFGNFAIPREGTLCFVAIIDGSKVYVCPGLEFMKIETKAPIATPPPA